MSRAIEIMSQAKTDDSGRFAADPSSRVTRPTIVCLTPVKNEAWILERFLRAASIWADHIIVADQNSDDGSQEIAKRFPKVKLIENRSATFNEPERQKMLIAEARKIPGQKLLVALDADEFLTANMLESAEWQQMLDAQPGTVIVFRWAVVLPDLKTHYIFPAQFPLGFMDDGSEHEGRVIHSPRIPTPAGAPRISMEDIRVLHYSVADLERFKSKIRWYQCWELLQGVNRGGFLGRYRWYHRDLWIPPAEQQAIPDKWMKGYLDRGIDVNGFTREKVYRWDGEILKLFGEHGVVRFRRLAVWDVNWRQRYEELYGEKAPSHLKDPRTWGERRVHRWLEQTQLYFSHFQTRQSALRSLYLRVVQKALRWSGW